jgi:adenylate kinase family enzyme
MWSTDEIRVEDSVSDYDFKTLNDKEFEILCADLLSKTFDTKFERFKPGRDLGVDGRFFSPSGKEVILQCKHWARTPLTQLIKSLQTVEKPKLIKLNPGRYIIAVSNSLSRANKKSIFDAMVPFIKSESDIFGSEDLNDILRSNKDIERQHYKLWMHSTGVIEGILNRAIIGRSRDEMLDIQVRSARYVTTENHGNAAKQLDKLHVVIITGEPGIGKTTLADQLCYEYSAKGYEFIKIDDDTAEAEHAFDEESKQLFYFDDFLGRNYLEALTGHEGGKITNFIRRISRNSNKLFILTSRSTILNQGKILFDTFYHANLERNEYELRMKSLSNLDKGKILYNHIWFSSLDPMHVEELYKEKRYLHIIKHKNFNPRLISYITDSSRLEHVSAEGYWSYIESSLANPAQIWENPFVAQQDDFSRALIILTVLNGRKIYENELSTSYHDFISMPSNQNLRGRQDYESNVKSLTGSFFNRYINAYREAEIDLFNPSIGDFVLSRYATNQSVLQSGFASLKTISSLVTFLSLYSNSNIKESDAQEIAIRIFNHAIKTDFVGFSVAYLSMLCTLVIGTFGAHQQLNSVMCEIHKHLLPNIESDEISYDFIKLQTWALKNNKVSALDILRYVSEHVNEISKDNEISSCWQLLQAIPIDTLGRDIAIENFEKAIVELVSDNLSDFIETTDAYSEFNYGEYELARERLAEMVNEKIESWGIPSGRINGELVVSSYDVEDNMNGFFQNSHEPDYDRGESRGHSDIHSDGAIIDLFDRS